MEKRRASGIGHVVILLGWLCLASAQTIAFHPRKPLPASPTIQWLANKKQNVQTPLVGLGVKDDILPDVQFFYDSFLELGSQLEITSTCTYDELAAVSYSFGDGSGVYNAVAPCGNINLTHTYKAPGNYTFEIDIKISPDWITQRFQRLVRVFERITPVKIAPVYYVKVGDFARFEAQCSHCNLSADDTILFSWDFGDGYMNITKASFAYHYYTQARSFVGKVYVSNMVSEAYTAFNVTSQAPIQDLNASVVHEVYQNQSITLNGAANGTYPIQYTWTFHYPTHQDSISTFNTSIAYSFAMPGEVRVHLQANNSVSAQNTSFITQVRAAPRPPLPPT
eukprot:Colp12_sorted_trinity150504_noHs@14608